MDAIASLKRPRSPDQSPAATKKQATSFASDDDKPNAPVSSKVVTNEKPKDASDKDAVAAECQAFEGRRVAKYFDGTLFYGTVDYWSPWDLNEKKVDLWGIKYDDGDQEDFEREEPEEYLELYGQFQAYDLLAASKHG